MPAKEPKFIVATVNGFDPNRPDLQEFLNSLVAEAMAGEAPKPRKRRRRAAPPASPRSRSQRAPRPR